MPMLMIRKWLDQNLPGIQEGQTMRDGRILFLTRDEATAQKAEMNSKRLYNICDIKVQRMDRMNQTQGTILRKRRGHTGSTENLSLYQGGANGSI
jgi:hypothetical protein